MGPNLDGDRMNAPIYSPTALRRALRTGTPDPWLRRFVRWLWSGTLLALCAALTSCAPPEASRLGASRPEPRWRTDYDAWAAESVTLTLPRTHMALLHGYAADGRLPQFVTYIRYSEEGMTDDSARALALDVSRAIHRALLQ